MKARLLKDARISHKAGETVEVSPAVFKFLASIGVAEAVAETAQEEQAKPKRTGRKKD